MPRYRFTLFRAADDEGAGAAAEATAAPAGDQQSADAGEATAKSAPSSILDFATPEKKDGQAAGDWKAPENVPEHLRGDSPEDTIAKLFNAYKGARDALAKGKPAGKGDEEAGAVPETIDGYKIEPTGDDDRAAAELNSEVNKPLIDAYRTAAKELGIGDKTFAAFMRKGMEVAIENGVPLGISAEEAQSISGEHELKQLVAQVGKQEAGTILNTVLSFGERMKAAELMDDAELAEFRVMVGTADSARLFYKILTGKLGEKPIPLAHGADGKVTPTEAYAAHERALKMAPGAERDQALAEAQALMRRAHGNASSGSIRSSVL